MSADKKRLRRGEFETRQRQLPASHTVRKAKGRAWTKARDDIAKTPIGAPPKPVDVRSVWDTRPINAFDFNIPVSLSAPSTGTEAVLEFTVPEGFVCVLRNFDIWFEPNPVGLNRSDTTWSLQLNGGDYPYNIGVWFGVAIDRETCFMVANEFNTVGLRIVHAAGFVTPGSIFARFYGNFLQKSGLPPSLEIGNLVPKAAIPPKPTRPPPLAPPPPSTPPPIMPSTPAPQGQKIVPRKLHSR